MEVGACGRPRAFRGQVSGRHAAARTMTPGELSSQAPTPLAPFGAAAPGTAAMPPPAAPAPSLGTRIGSFLQTLRRTLRDLEQRQEEARRLSEITSCANDGLLLDDVVGQVYEAFRP